MHAHRYISLSLQTNRLTLAVSCIWTDFRPQSSWVQSICMHCLGNPYWRGHICKRYRKRQLAGSQSVVIFAPWRWANNLIVTASLALLPTYIHTASSTLNSFLLVLISRLQTYSPSFLTLNDTLQYIFSTLSIFLGLHLSPLFSPFLPIYFQFNFRAIQPPYHLPESFPLPGQKFLLTITQFLRASWRCILLLTFKRKDWHFQGSILFFSLKSLCYSNFNL